MRLSSLPLQTSKEVPADAEIISHQLMLRAGLIRKLAAGMYTWMPIGLRVLRKVENIVREEMNRAGALELLMPSVQPAELWQETGRWESMGKEMLRMRDRHEREFCYGPTHEEVITDIVRRDINSYRQLPVTYYQIQTKFRDEIRPRFGVMRAREFIMKDAYSFNLDADSLQETYEIMYGAYTAIFERIGLRFRAVLADSGNIGGAISHEFHVLADSGEDAIAFSDGSDFAANVERAAAPAPAQPRPAAGQAMDKVPTPQDRTIEKVCERLNVQPSQCVKTLIVEAADGSAMALLVRGDHELNEVKASKLEQVAAPLKLASPQQVHAAANCEPGFVGPLGLNCPIIADQAVLAMADFVCGANEVDMHLTGVNWERDLPQPPSADLRTVMDGDASPDGHGTLQIVRGIEVGHVFQLGDKYSEAMAASVLDENGRNITLQMGCYGIGITRIVAAAIEQNNDESGIIWPDAIAPFALSLIPINLHKSYRVREATDALYEALTCAGVDVLYDDRNARPGVKFAECELLGIPHRLVISERGIDAGQYEYKHRCQSEAQSLPIDDIMEQLRARMS